MSRARELVAKCIAHPGLLDGIEDTADLRDAGLNSGVFVLIALRIEEEIDRPLSDTEMDTLSTLRDIEAILSGAATGVQGG
jgi:acyl carrier protein